MTDNDGHRAFPILVTQRLVLRETRLSDAAEVFSIASDPEVQRWDGGPVQDRDTVLEEIREARADADAGRGYRWAITEKPHDTVIGDVTLTNWSKAHYRAEIGYALARDHWRRHIGSEAVRAVVRFAFEELGLHRVEAFPTVDNIASVRLLESLGFVREGTAREVLLMDDGCYHDVGQYSMLSREYRQGRHS
jgi:[ribosomal protein S5]-alanine N-acetyltransferase